MRGKGEKVATCFLFVLLWDTWHEVYLYILLSLYHIMQCCKMKMYGLAAELESGITVWGRYWTGMPEPCQQLPSSRRGVAGPWTQWREKERRQKQRVGCWNQETVFSTKIHSYSFHCKLEQTEYILLSGLGMSCFKFLRQNLWCHGKSFRKSMLYQHDYKFPWQLILLRENSNMQSSIIINCVFLILWVTILTLP